MRVVTQSWAASQGGALTSPADPRKLGGWARAGLGSGALLSASPSGGHSQEEEFGAGDQLPRDSGPGSRQCTRGVVAAQSFPPEHPGSLRGVDMPARMRALQGQLPVSRWCRHRVMGPWALRGESARAHSYKPGLPPAFQSHMGGMVWSLLGHCWRARRGYLNGCAPPASSACQ